LVYEAYTRQDQFARRYKIGNVVLMAPDIDVDVASAKIFKALSDPDMPYGQAPPNPGMRFERVPGFRLTVYMSPEDKALATSSWLFGSIARLGGMGKNTMTPKSIDFIRTVGFIDMIVVPHVAGWLGHSYFTSDSRVSADLIAVLRYGLRPNEPGRPLEEIDRPLWQLPTQRGADSAK
jgi:esterase/lipase superfamily enzyme